MSTQDTTNAGPLALSLHAGLGPLPEADGSAEANIEPHPGGAQREIEDE
jgi:hypothetical protein